jgi:sulfoxide reductase catalytic subunit YedY
VYFCSAAYIHVGIDEILTQLTLEERVYRHRCVEAWSMVVPWTGFPLKALLDLAGPRSGAKYVRFQSFHEPEIASGQEASWYPWPYIEALTIAEAENELAFMVTGAYGQPLAKQYGAPLRLALPWKYGFKSIKSVQRITLTEDRPETFWEEAGAGEYGFWANVNPKVSHPRWSQKTERVLGTRERIPTRIYNGYGDVVAHLYKDIKGEKLFK